VDHKLVILVKNVLAFGDVTADVSRSDIIEHVTALLPELFALYLA
jgi:hypothetical protein